MSPDSTRRAVTYLCPECDEHWHISVAPPIQNTLVCVALVMLAAGLLLDSQNWMTAALAALTAWFVLGAVVAVRHWMEVRP